MEKFLWRLTLCVFIGFPGLQAAAQSPGFDLVGIGSREVPVTLYKMTNLVFPVNIQKGIKVSGAVLAQKVQGVENVIELKALRRKFSTTNLSVYGKNGRLYSFVLRFSEDSSVLNFRVVDDGHSRADVVRTDVPVAVPPDDHPVHLSGLPVDAITLAADAGELAGERGFLHQAVTKERMRLVCKGIYLRDSLEWIAFRLANHSQISYRPGFMRFYTEDRKKVKRKAIQQMILDPVYDGQPGEVAGDTAVRFATGFTPFTVPPGKNLVVEMAESEGGRVLVMKIKGKMFLRARKR